MGVLKENNAWEWRFFSFKILTRSLATKKFHALYLPELMQITHGWSILLQLICMKCWCAGVKVSVQEGLQATCRVLLPTAAPFPTCSHSYPGHFHLDYFSLLPQLYRDYEKCWTFAQDRKKGFWPVKLVSGMSLTRQIMCLLEICRTTIWTNVW